MSRELNQYYFKIQNIEALAGADGFPCEGAVAITGADLADVETITFTHAGGPTVVNAPFTSHTDTQINVLSPALAGKTVTSIKITDTDGNDTILGSLSIAVSPLIDVTSVVSNDPARIQVLGTGLASVNGVVVDVSSGPDIVITNFDFQDDTSIAITSNSLAGKTVNGVTAHDACTGTDSLTGLTLAVSDYMDCADQTIVIVNPTDLKINGADLSQVDRVRIATDGGTYNLYDPTGPHSANNTPGTTVVTWTNVEIEVDLGVGVTGETVDTVELRSVQDVLMTGESQLPADYCEPVGLTFP